MREILFKAKRIDNGEWVEGYLVKACQNTYPNGYEIIDKNGINYDELDCWQSSFTSYEVDEKTICQYTGLVDKNGNKIWENDICSTDIKRPYAIVEFRNGCFMYNLNDGAKDYYDIMMPTEPLVDSDKYTEVIGNIFDNPELLKQ